MVWGVTRCRALTVPISISYVITRSYGSTSGSNTGLTPDRCRLPNQPAHQHDRPPEIAPGPSMPWAFRTTQRLRQCGEDSRDELPCVPDRNPIIVADRQTELLEFPSLQCDRLRPWLIRQAVRIGAVVVVVASVVKIIALRRAAPHPPSPPTARQFHSPRWIGGRTPRQLVLEYTRIVGDLATAR